MKQTTVTRDFQQSEDYEKFHSSIPLRKLFVDDDNNLAMSWKVYDAGPKTVNYPIVFLPPVSASADIYFQQLLHLSNDGYRVISLDYPAYTTIQQFCRGLEKVINTLGLLQVHVFASGFGGFLMLNFFESYRYKQLVVSLFLCNSFTDTALIRHKGHQIFKIMPFFALRNIAMKNLRGDCDAAAFNFVSESCSTFTKKQLACRLACRYTDSFVDNLNILQSLHVTLMHTFDDQAVHELEKLDICKHFPMAKLAHLKRGGRFPFLTQSSEVNFHVKLHVQNFVGTIKSPKIA